MKISLNVTSSYIILQQCDLFHKRSRIQNRHCAGPLSTAGNIMRRFGDIVIGRTLSNSIV